MITQAYFENIKSVIARELSLAKISIHIAVAWFTDEDLLEILIRRAENGVKVCVLMLNNEINTVNFGIDFSLLKKVGGSVNLIGNRDEMMHNKFCVIDSEIVITGSYNWTRKAVVNNENIVIVKGSKSLPVDYISEFYNLFKKYLIEIPDQTLEKRLLDRNVSKLLPYQNSKDKWGFCTIDRNIIIEPQFDFVKPFSEGLAAVKGTNGLYGYINKFGETVINFKYGEANSFKGGFASVRQNWINHWGLIDKYGRCINETSNIFCGKVESEIIRFKDLSGYYFYNIKTFKKSQYFHLASDFNSGLAFVIRQFFDNKGKRNFSDFGCIDESYNLVIPHQYTSAHQFNDGYAMVTYNNKKGVIDKEANFIDFSTFDDISDYSEGFIPAKNRDSGKWGYIDINKNLVVPFRYDRAFKFENGFGIIKNGNRYGFLNKNGIEITELKYSEAENFNNGVALVRDGFNYEYIDTNGVELWGD